MTQPFALEIAANRDRAAQSLRAARELVSTGHHDYAASRAYYAAYYSALALLLNDGLEFNKNSGAIAAIHQRYVKTGRLDKSHGKDLNWLFEIRGLGDYGGTAHVSAEQAERAIEAAERFFEAAEVLLG